MQFRYRRQARIGGHCFGEVLSLEKSEVERRLYFHFALLMNDYFTFLHVTIPLGARCANFCYQREYLYDKIPKNTNIFSIEVESNSAIKLSSHRRVFS